MKRTVIKSGGAARLLTVALALLAIALPARAQTPKVAQSGMTFLQIPIGARGAAMGYTNSAVVNDASAFYWNPSGYAFIEGTSLFANRTQWIGDINVNAAAISHNAGRLGVIGLNLTAVDWGDFQGTRRADNDAGYEDTGTFSPTSMAVGMSYAYLISTGFGVGANVKYLYERLGSGFVGSFD
ncbi:MAG TPA: PorV/PorQ family protein, partial [Rhodothermales bacterium]